MLLTFHLIAQGIEFVGEAENGEFGDELYS